ncbi:hypothetical protein TIFTF001_032176 [Ficus carica]|uniref:Uncharacterized protein n=1 Tax=Ficus carica TaxID=3494 RepID=A0AA88J6E0_FICCA|nr:hypothetical protein TIFTF001_032176 [Ficus carica]
MAKNRNKKTRNSSAMEITVESVSDVPQAMDTSEAGAQNPVFDYTNL